MSINAQILGVHEPVVTAFISDCASSGYNNFLLDIGANIGITSCQNGNDFSYVHMFEPNPLCQKILEVNTSIILNKPELKLHKFALGTTVESADLVVPRHNWGGGYIATSDNTYDKDVLAKKDGFSEYNEANYLKFDVEIRDAKAELKNIFDCLQEKEQSRGVIKIDVEGYEPVVIEAIAASIPCDIECFVIFESFNPDLDIESLEVLFNGRAKAYKISEVKPFRPSLPKFLKAFSILFNRSVYYHLDLPKNLNYCEDLVIEIKKG